MKKNQTPEEVRLTQNESQSTKAEPAKARTHKIDTVLNLLFKGVSLNRFEAEHFGDHCLHSTISELRNRYYFEILDDWEEVPNRFGHKTSVKRYWLSDQEREKAARFLRRRQPENSDTPNQLEV